MNWKTGSEILTKYCMREKTLYEIHKTFTRDWKFRCFHLRRNFHSLIFFFYMRFHFCCFKEALRGNENEIRCVDPCGNSIHLGLFINRPYAIYPFVQCKVHIMNFRVRRPFLTVLPHGGFLSRCSSAII